MTTYILYAIAALSYGAGFLLGIHYAKHEMYLLAAAAALSGLSWGAVSMALAIILERLETISEQSQ